MTSASRSFRFRLRVAPAHRAASRGEMAPVFRSRGISLSARISPCGLALRRLRTSSLSNADPPGSRRCGGERRLPDRGQPNAARTRRPASSSATCAARRTIAKSPCGCTLGERRTAAPLRATPASGFPQATRRASRGRHRACRGFGPPRSRAAGRAQHHTRAETCAASGSSRRGLACARLPPDRAAVASSGRVADPCSALRQSAAPRASASVALEHGRRVHAPMRHRALFRLAILQSRYP